MGDPGSLAGRSDGRGDRRQCGLHPDIIAWYEQVFFAVRACRRAEKYLLFRVVGDGVQRGFRDEEVGNFWAWVTLGGGPLVVEDVIRAFHAARQPGEPAALSIYLRPGTEPGLQATVASMVLPSNSPAWTEANLRLREADAAVDPDHRAVLRERARDWLVRCAGLAGRQTLAARQAAAKAGGRPRTHATGRRAAEQQPGAHAGRFGGEHTEARSPVGQRARRLFRRFTVSGTKWLE